jgi:hypothetical protein
MQRSVTGAEKLELKCSKQKKTFKMKCFKIQGGLACLLHVNQLWNPRANDKLRRGRNETTDAAE